jgi:NADPH:quinone reductase-like Zn-dependent oxidoreductase/acyl carrier protein
LDASGTELDALLQELRMNDGEREVAWRAERRFVARLERASELQAPDGENYALETSSNGMLDALSLVEAVRRAPARGEVEIAVLASGLNFRDVLNTLGMFPGDAGPLGNECAGVVVRVGADVDRVAPGDAVMAFGAGMFRRYVTVDARQVVAKPANLSWDEAAGTPLVFLTAWYALHDLASLRRGERILVHAAAGGVGMAAVQVAHMLGAEVLATASPSKWDVLRALGVARLASSRDVTFAREFGPTAHVVLNALSGEFVDASLSVLEKGGRFLEMGKTDIRDPKVVAESHPGIRYRAFDLSEAGLDRIAQMLDVIAEALRTGALRPLPLTRFAVTEAEAAFRFMGQARHIGKVVLTAPRDEHGFRRDGTVVVTGGLGALGLHIAHWLVERGVKHLLLLGRRGMTTPGAPAAVAELTARGTSVRVKAVDVADRRALNDALADVDPHAPLRGVIHAAGVLDDGILSDQTPERFARVIAAKAEGAQNLDVATRGADLDFFVLFSSIAGTLGSAGQGAYAASNAFLDALAWRRRAEGRPALSLAWGPWSDGGMASARMSPSQQNRLVRRGALPLAPAQGLALFASALARPEPALVVAALDLDAVSRAFDVEIPHVWRELVHARDARSSEPTTQWLSELRTLPPVRQLPAVLDAVRTEIARVLSLGSAHDVPDDQLLSDLGLDSLMAVELRNAIARRVGTSLHATLAFDYPTAIALSKYLVQRVLLLEPSSETTKTAPELDVTPPSHGDRVANILAEIAALTEREQQTLADALFERGS